MTALSILSFTSSAAACALSTASSMRPLTSPLCSWLAPPRLRSRSPVSTPTACFTRPLILSVCSPMSVSFVGWWGRGGSRDDHGSVVAPPTANRAAHRAENHEDHADHEQDHPEGREDRHGEEEPPQ